MTGRAFVLRGDAAHLPLPDASVDLIVTSPPYYALRSYTDGGVHYPGQIGSEATPAAYIDTLVDCTREWARVLKPSGSLFVDLGDKYGRGTRTTVSGSNAKTGYADPGRVVPTGNDKSLMLLPERYRIAAVDRLGLICRAVIVWNKPNGLPESVTDRVRRSHEDWVHLTKEPRYYSAVDEIREEHARTWTPGSNGGKARQALGGTMAGLAAAAANPLGKLPGSVWTIPTEPLTVPPELGIDHFAAYPTEWPRRLILGWSPPGICVACGEGRRPIHDGTEKHLHRPSGATRVGTGMAAVSHSPRVRTNAGNVHTVHRITGYVCACPDTSAAIRPAIVLDPFGGTGTTALVARALGRIGISIDMSADYSRLAVWRTTDPGELAKAMRVDKPPPVDPDQLGLFEVS